MHTQSRVRKAILKAKLKDTLLDLVEESDSGAELVESVEEVLTTVLCELAHPPLRLIRTEPEDLH